MRYHCSLLAAVVLLAAAGTPAIGLTDVPAAAQNAINAQLAGGKLDDIAQTNDDGEIVFDVSFTALNGDERDFTVAADGTLLSLEVKLAETPFAVQRAIRAEAAGWDLESVDKNVDRTEISYEVEVSQGGQSKSFTVTEDGDVLSRVIELTNAPAAVRQAIHTKFAGAEVQSVAVSFDADYNTNMYDVELTTVEGIGKSFRIATDGTMVSTKVFLEAVTPRASKTITEKIAGGKILRIDETLLRRPGGALPYEVHGRKNGRPFDFSVGRHGGFMGMDD